MSSPPTHLTDGDLIQFMDQEMEPERLRQVIAHIAACLSCSERLNLFQGEKGSFADLLSELPVAPIQPAWREATWEEIERVARKRPVNVRFARSWFGPRAAAAVAGLALASAALVSPARALLTISLATLAGETDRPEEMATAPPSSARIPMHNAVIGFIPTDNAFLLDVRSAQQLGRLVLSVGPGANASAQAIGEGEATMVVLPNGVRIENQKNATADYVLTLPAHLREVRLRVGKAPEIVYSVEALATSWISAVSLSPPG